MKSHALSRRVVIAIYPREGTETFRMFLRHDDGDQIAIYPREGTETFPRLRPLLDYVLNCHLSPRGDGNRSIFSP